MTARGYRGDAHSITAFRLTGADVAAAACVVAAVVVIYGGDRLVGR